MRCSRERSETAWLRDEGVEAEVKRGLVETHGPTPLVSGYSAVQFSYNHEATLGNHWKK